MKLYIEIRDGAPYGHPILEDNFKICFPDIDTENLPSNFAKFERVQPNEIGIYQIYEGVSYEWDGEVVKDVHKIREMTLEEKTEKQKICKDFWAYQIGRGKGYPSWLFDEATCSFVSPVPRPDNGCHKDGVGYYWDEASISWIKKHD